MSAIAPPDPRLSFAWPRRPALALTGALLALGIAALCVRLTGGAVAIPAALAFAALGATLLLARLAPAQALDGLVKIEGGFALAVLLAAVTAPDPGVLSMMFGALALGGAGAGAVRLARANAARRNWGAPFGLILALGALGALHAAYFIAQSQDMMIADFMRNRLVSFAVSQKIAGGEIARLLALLAGSLKEDYSWLPALPTGAALALGGPLSRGVYQGAVALFYVGPALFALGALARGLAKRAGLALGFLPGTAFAALAAFAIYPAGVVVADRGMPDIFGLVFVALALRHAEKLWRTLALPERRGALPDAMMRRLTLALCLDLFAMFAFRRWFIFAGVGILATLAVGLAARPLQTGQFAWARAVQAAALGMLALLGLFAPILADWLPNLRAHDYVDIYAAYRKPPTVDVMRAVEWVGVAPFALALVGAFLALRQCADRKLLILTLGSALVAAALFFRVQSPAAHHYYLIAPALTACAALPLLMLFARSRALGAAALAAWAALALAPGIAGSLPRGIFAPGGLPHAPRTDLAELARLRAFVDAQSPGAAVCGLGSSYTFSGQLIGELWQLDPARSPRASRAVVQMSDVDAVEGAPNRAMKDCAVMIVGSPVQTHLVPDFQQTVILPSREMLSGEGIGARYRRTGEAFHLEHGVEAVVFERTSPLSDDDMRALAERWQKARLNGPLELRGDIDPENLARSP